MLKSKSTLFISLLFAAQLASAGGVVIEKQVTPPFDESLNGSVMLEQSTQAQRSGGVILERGIIVQDKLAGGVMLEREHLPKRSGIIVDDISVKSQLAGGVMLERGIILQKQFAGSVMLENSPQLNRGGSVIIEKQLSA